MKAFIILLIIDLLVVAAVAIRRFRAGRKSARNDANCSGPEAVLPDLPMPDVAGDNSGAAPYDKKLYVRSCAYMEQKRPFLVESFTLDDFAARLYTNKLYLSKTINHYSGGNFRQFVNHFRVKYAMGLFEKNMSLRVSDMSELSGFHNVVTFNNAFKLMTGETPSAWCRKIRTRRILGK